MLAPVMMKAEGTLALPCSDEQARTKSVTFWRVN